MRFEKVIPTQKLQPYISYFAISENDKIAEYKVFPSPGLVAGFQYRGKLTMINQHKETPLASAGVTGISESCKIFKSSAGVGTILVYFTETGFSHFNSNPVHELFNQSVALEDVFGKSRIAELEEKLGNADTDQQRVKITENFFLSLLKDIHSDKLIIEAVKLIYDSKGAIRISELNKKLLISQSPFEKRFRKLVGTSPKKFASIVRFNSVLKDLSCGKSLTDLCYENNFFDQAHFIKDFRQYTGNTPEQFRRFQ
ncbi:helix-turn-helix transcriptional regulator [Pollutibacter soli]|uniref:helix-turn-helix transcriptional regulator n=1 Tax=Pollutibacter soli TaxID=3034157 RepID=UPI0030136B9D